MIYNCILSLVLLANIFNPLKEAVKNYKPANNIIYLESSMTIRFPDSTFVKLPFNKEENVKYFKFNFGKLITVVDTIGKDSLINRFFFITDVITRKTNTIRQFIDKKNNKYFVEQRSFGLDTVYLKQPSLNSSLTEVITKFILENKAESFDYFFGDLVYVNRFGTITYYNSHELFIKKLLNNNPKEKKKISKVNFSCFGNKIIYISKQMFEKNDIETIINVYDIKNQIVSTKLKMQSGIEGKLSPDGKTLMVVVYPELIEKYRNKMHPIYDKIVLFDLVENKTKNTIYEYNACWCN